MGRRSRALALAGALIAASTGLATTTAAASTSAPSFSVGTLQSPGCTSGPCFMGDGNVGVFFTATVTTQGGNDSLSRPFTWSLIGGSLPAGLNLEEATITEAWVLGTPATTGTSTFTVQATDDAGNTARQSFTISIGTGKLDNIVITQAAYNTEKHELFVAANDPNTDVTVTASLTNGPKLGYLHTFGDGNYNATFYLSSSANPVSITVKSSRGASATSAVTFFRGY